MFGSHNWSNEGVKTNRDASLIFDDEEIAAYLAEVYDYDWNTLATAHPTRARPRVAKDGEETPRGLQARAVFRGLRGWCVNVNPLGHQYPRHSLAVG